MKGIIFNLVEDSITEHHGDDAWDTVLDSAGVDGGYTSLGNYPDEELGRVVAAGSQELNTSPEDLARWLGTEALGKLATRYPEFFTPHGSTRPFLLTLNDIIHAEVRKLHSGADLPYFDFDVVDDDVLVMGYRSQRRLCAFAEGMIAGAALHYGEPVTIDQPSCMLLGDELCTIRCRFERAPAG